MLFTASVHKNPAKKINVNDIQHFKCKHRTWYIIKIQDEGKSHLRMGKIAASFLSLLELCLLG